MTRERERETERERERGGGVGAAAALQCFSVFLSVFVTRNNHVSNRTNFTGLKLRDCGDRGKLHTHMIFPSVRRRIWMDAEQAHSLTWEQTHGSYSFRAGAKPAFLTIKVREVLKSRWIHRNTDDTRALLLLLNLFKRFLEYFYI